jgi:hypothetical protein
MATEPGASPSRGGMLDSPPPAPPSRGGASLVDNQMSRTQGAGLGAEAGNPQIVALQGLAMLEQGTQLLSSTLPQLGPALGQLMAQLRQVIPQAMADQLAGIENAGAPGAMGAAGGGMAPTAPPPAGAGAPVAS